MSGGNPMRRALLALLVAVDGAREAESARARGEFGDDAEDCREIRDAWCAVADAEDMAREALDADAIAADVRGGA